MKALRMNIARWFKSRLRIDPLTTNDALQADPSQLGESKILECILNALKNQGFEVPRTFLEIGANSAYSLSCTWYLEKTCGFKGVSVEPLNHVSHEFLKHRENTLFINRAFAPCTQETNLTVFYQCGSSVLSTTDKKEAEAMQKMGYTFTATEVDTIRTEELYQHFENRIGILIIDIESLPLQIQIINEIIRTKLKPLIICVETLDFSPASSNLRSEYDRILNSNYEFVAGTYLNSIYLSLDIHGE